MKLPRLATTIILILGICLLTILPSNGQAVLVYRGVAPQLIQANLFANHQFTEGSGQIVYNRTTSPIAPLFINLFGTGSEQFKTNANNTEGWVLAPATTLTDFFAADPLSGSNGATRLVCTATAGQGISSDQTLTVQQYTVSFYVKSNTGSTQNIRLSNVTSTSSDLPVTTSWIQQSFTFTGTAGVNSIVLENDAANEALDILIYGAILQTGASASTYIPPTFNLQLGSLSIADAHDPTWQTYGADLGSDKWTYGISTVGASTTNFTVYTVAKKTGANASGGFEPIFNNGNAGLAGFFSINTQDIFSDPLQGTERPDFLFGTGHAYANSINLTDGAWHIFAATYNGTTMRFYCDGSEVASTTSSQTALNIHRLYYGEYPTLSKTTFYFPGSVGIGGAYTAAHSATTVRQMTSILSSGMATRGIAAGNPHQFVIIDGDSISDPNLTSTGLTIYQGWSYLMFHDISPVVLGRNFATGGATIATMSARGASVDATFNPNISKNILSILIGRNDLTSVSPATYVANLKAYCIARKAANPALLINIVPIMPSTAVGFNALRNTANALVAADPDFTNGVAADHIAVVDPAMWDDVAAADVAKYSDGTHPTVAAMATYVEPVMKTAITSLF